MVKKTNQLARFIRDVPIDKITVARLENLLSSAIRVNECRLRLNPHHTGYTYLNISGVKYPAHRIVMVVATGNNSPALLVDHLCRNRSCVRLSHLEFVTESENVRRGEAWHHFLKKKEQTHCLNGHSLEDALASVRPSGTVKRECRTCHMLRERKRRQRVREEIQNA